MIKKHAVNAINNFTISYTILMIGQLILSILGVWNELNNERALQLLLICFTVNLLQFFTSFIQIENFCLELFIRVVEMFLVVFILGGKILHMFDYSLSNLLSIGGILIVISLGLCVFAYFANIMVAQRINEIIKKKKK